MNMPKPFRGGSPTKAKEIRDQIAPMVRDLLDLKYSENKIAESLGVSNAVVRKIVDENAMIPKNIKGVGRFDMRVRVSGSIRRHVIKAATVDAALSRLQEAYPGANIEVISSQKLEPLNSRAVIHAVKRKEWG